MLGLLNVRVSSESLLAAIINVRSSEIFFALRDHVSTSIEVVADALGIAAQLLSFRSDSWTNDAVDSLIERPSLSNYYILEDGTIGKNIYLQ